MAAVAPPPTLSSFCPDKTLTTFARGPSNEMASTFVEKYVVQRPRQAIMPGGNSLGKTHLLHAAGNMLVTAKMRVQLVRGTDAEQPPLENGIDALLVDDLHLIPRDGDYQEQLARACERMTALRKPLLISVRDFPLHRQKFHPALNKALDCLMTIEIGLPSYDTRKDIVKAIARRESVTLPDEVVSYLAELKKTGIVYDGIVKTLGVQQELQGLEITRQAAERAVYVQYGRMTLAAVPRKTIIDAVAKYYDVQPAKLRAPSNQAGVARPRQVAMYLISELTNASLSEIGAEFRAAHTGAPKHHTTVLHSIAVVKKRMARAPSLEADVQRIRDAIYA